MFTIPGIRVHDALEWMFTFGWNLRSRCPRIRKRAHKGVFHKLSPKHLQRYVNEFAGKHNVRDEDTLAQMVVVAAGLVGKRLMYRDLIAQNGLSSGARSSGARS